MIILEGWGVKSTHVMGENGICGVLYLSHRGWAEHSHLDICSMWSGANCQISQQSSLVGVDHQSQSPGSESNARVGRETQKKGKNVKAKRRTCYMTM